MAVAVSGSGGQLGGGRLEGVSGVRAHFINANKPKMKVDLKVYFEYMLFRRVKITAAFNY